MARSVVLIHRIQTDRVLSVKPICNLPLGRPSGAVKTTDLGGTFEDSSLPQRASRFDSGTRILLISGP